MTYTPSTSRSRAIGRLHAWSLRYPLGSKKRRAVKAAMFALAFNSTARRAREIYQEAMR